jgi:hypothetical protein
MRVLGLVHIPSQRCMQGKGSRVARKVQAARRVTGWGRGRRRRPGAPMRAASPCWRRGCSGWRQEHPGRSPALRNAGRAHTRRGRRARVRRALGAGAPHAPLLHACARVRRCRGGVGRAAPRHAHERFSVVRVVLALSAAASSLAPLVPMSIPAACGAGARAAWARRARVRHALGAGAPHAPLLHACARVRRRRGGVGRAAPRHAPWRSSVVRVVLSLSAAASRLIPLSPTVEPAAHGWRTRSCGDSAGLGRCAVARTGEVQLGAALADLLQRRSDRFNANHVSRPSELARSTATRCAAAARWPAQRGR